MSDYSNPLDMKDLIEDVVQDIPIDDFIQGIGDIVSIALTPSSTVTSTLQMVATATLDDGNTRTVTTEAGIVWASSDLTKATVSAAGLVTGVADGSATITAKLAGITGSRTLTIDVP